MTTGRAPVSMEVTRDERSKEKKQNTAVIVLRKNVYFRSVLDVCLSVSVGRSVGRSVGGKQLKSNVP